MSPIDRKVRKRAKAKAKAQAEAKAKAKTEAEAKAKAEAIAKAKAMFSRSNQSENPAFRALVDKLRGMRSFPLLFWRELLGIHPFHVLSYCLCHNFIFNLRLCFIGPGSRVSS